MLGGLVGAGVFIVMYGYLAETQLFNSVLGGKVTLAQNAKYDALVGGVNGAVLALIIGISLIAVSLKLPKSLR